MKNQIQQKAFIKLTEEEEYHLDIVFNVFDKQKSQKIETCMIADILICLDYNITNKNIEHIQKLLDHSNKGYFSLPEFKSLMCTEYIYDLKFNPKISEQKLKQAIINFSDKQGNVKQQTLIKGIQEMGPQKFPEDVISQFKKDSEKITVSGNLDVNALVKLIL